VWRWGRIERRIDRDVDQVITIGAPDLPRHPTRRPPVCITPTLDFKADAWLYSGSRSAFFVGSMGHYPNRLAIEWIATRLAPAVAALGADIRFTVIGAAEAEVPETWRHPAVDYLGASDRAEVERQFRSADLFLCPVSNTFGMKFKMAEALAFGIPMLAAPESMLCVPYLPASPNLPLDDPASAAKAVCALVGNAEALQARSSLQRALQEQFVDTQQGIWSRTLPFH
jgi:glycosyltransferase involved in cell wall biosynthesis